MVRGGSYDARGGSFTARSGVYAQSGRVGEMIESFEGGFPVADGEWTDPTWGGDAVHQSNISRTGQSAIRVDGYYEGWVLPETFRDTPPALGRPIRMWLYPFDWRSGSGTGTQYWFTLGDPEEDSRDNRLEFNLIHNGTARMRYRNGSARTLDTPSGDTAHINNAHDAIEEVWYALDIYSPGSTAMSSGNWDEGETLPPGEWQAALHEDGEDEDPIAFDFTFSEYQDWDGEELKAGVWVGYSGDEAIFDDIQFLPDLIDDSDPGEGDEFVIDDFESYDSSSDLQINWTVDGGGSAEVSASASLVDGSTQGIVQTGNSQIRSFPGQGLDNYPEDGQEVGVHMRHNSDSQQPWILVSMQDDTWTSETDNYRLITFAGGGIRIIKEVGSSDTILAEDTGYNISQGDLYDVRFTFDSSTGIDYYLLDEGGSVVAQCDTSDTELIESEMSIGFRTAGGCEWDNARQIDEE